METLEVHLQEGFEGDIVLLQVEDQDPVQQANVTTKLLYGYAAVITVRVPEGKIQLRVTLPERQLSDTVELQIPDERFVGVSLMGGKIEVVKSHEVFGYM